MGDKEVAVCLRKACKSYGRGVNVLNNLDLTVERGSIYGLLGSSGCGKTTLLGCIVGLLELNKGDVTVFGKSPGTKGSGVPGPRIGYMPQEVALVNEFTVKCALYYFGWLFGMTSKQISERYSFLSKLLQLPSGSQLIKDLSGGQQRRVSFAAALVQMPELLILDEPTVGLDPVLRQTIWDYLVEISSNNKTTIIITTHYIEEANQAHKIGLLRGGSLLAEGSPENLLAQYNTTSLEQVFLTLSQKQTLGAFCPPTSTREKLVTISVLETTDVEADEHIDPNPAEHTQHVDKVADKHVDNNTDQHVDNNTDQHHNNTDKHVGNSSDQHVDPNDNQHGDQIVDHTPEQAMSMVDLSAPITPPPPLYRKSHLLPMRALMFKSFTRILNTYGGLFFLFVFPLLEVCIFFTSTGRDPEGLRIGIVNQELGNCRTLSGELKSHSGVTTLEEFECNFFGLSCLLMDVLDDHATTHIYYDSVEEAKAATMRGVTAGTMLIPANFSHHLEERVRNGKDATNQTIVNSEIGVWLDMSDFTGLSLRKHLYETYLDFAKHVAAECQENVKKADVPIVFNDPVHGSRNPVYTLYLAPGIMISMVFFLATTLTISVVSIDRAEKSWDRDLVAGVTSTEIVISHLLTQCVCVVIQMVEILSLGFFVFDMHCHGSVANLLGLMIIQGLSGVTFGMLISIASKNLTTAAYVGMGSFFPFILTSGTLWPLEGMPVSLRYISQCLPNTWATTALRNILDKGWGALHPGVYGGFLIPIAWIVGQSAICIGLLHSVKK